jgi:general secretion pathway protein J
MFIAAVIFAMGYGAINQAVKSHTALQEQQARLLELQTGMRVIEQDFIQLAPRPIRQPLGAGYLPVLQSTPSIPPLATLTRAGWANPTGLQRPTLQRVAYYFDKDTLRREYWTVLDATQTSTTIKRDLITHLKSVSLRFMDVSKTWQPQWPPTTSSTTTDPRARPTAVEVTLETEDWGKLVRIFEISG